MSYRLNITVTDVDFGDKAGAARSSFDPNTDTLAIEVDTSRLVAKDFSFVIGHEVGHHIHGLHPSICKDLPVPGKIEGEGFFMIGDELDPLPIEEYIADTKAAAGFTRPPWFKADDPKPFEAMQATIAAMPKNEGPFAVPRSIIPFIEGVTLRDNRIPEDKPREYDVTVRRPTWAYAHDIIRATSAEDAIAKAKVKLTSNREDGFYFEADTDSMDPADWISAEGDGDHAEWDEPTLSPGVLVEALNKIELFTRNAKIENNDPKVYEQALAWISDTVREALNKAVRT